MILLGTLVGCSLKPQPAASNEMKAQEPLSKLVRVSLNERFVARSLRTELSPGEANTVQYRLLSIDLTEVENSPRTFKFEYRMPEMPEMGVFESAVEFDGKVLKGDLDIVHGGWWEVKILIEEPGKPVDEITFDYQVAE
ncbi:MAG: hypothetical protein EB078_09905 [Proteobacteria bacterium]|nr:hypothetical protein [Pseudomonadota bacterium]